MFFVFCGLILGLLSVPQQAVGGKFPGADGHRRAYEAARAAKPVCDQAAVIWVVDEQGELVDRAACVFGSAQMVLCAAHTINHEKAAAFYVQRPNCFLGDWFGLKQRDLEKFCKKKQAFRVSHSWAYDFHKIFTVDVKQKITSGFEENFRDRVRWFEQTTQRYPWATKGVHNPVDCQSSKKPAAWSGEVGAAAAAEEAVEASALQPPLVEQPDIAFAFLKDPVAGLPRPFVLEQPDLTFEQIQKATDVLITGYGHTAFVGPNAKELVFHHDDKVVLQQMAVAAGKTSFQESPCGCFGAMFDIKPVGALSENFDVPEAQGLESHAGMTLLGYSGGPLSGIVEGPADSVPSRRVLGVLTTHFNLGLKRCYDKALAPHKNVPDSKAAAPLKELRALVKKLETETVPEVSACFLFTPEVLRVARDFQTACLAKNTNTSSAAALEASAAMAKIKSWL